MAVAEAKPAPVPTVKQPPPAKPQAPPVAVAGTVTKNPPKVYVEERPPVVEKAPAAPAVVAERRPEKTVNQQQLSENLYRQAIGQLQQGKGNEARRTLRQSLEASAGNVGARQLLVGLLVEGGDLEEATRLLRDGLKLSPDQSTFSMTLARLQVERGDAKGGMATLEQGLRSAGNDAQYHGFYAALLQGADRHEDAVRHYLVALRSDPGMPSWLVGIGISLQALGKNSDAVEAFQRAKDSGMLSPQLNGFVDQRLGQLRR